MKISPRVLHTVLVIGLLFIALNHAGLCWRSFAQFKERKPATTPTRKPGPPTPAPRKSTSSAPTRRTAPEIEMVLVPGGSFLMGSPENELDRASDEGPQHRVTVPNFYIGKYEVTQAQWRAVMGSNPSQFKGDNLPVEKISWHDAKNFCRKLSKMTDKGYRLPTEAEWEYASHAGTTTPFAFGSSLSSEQANFNGNFPYGGAPKSVDRRKTTRIGSFAHNDLKIYDMHGNVWEWCEDVWHENYSGAPTDGSAWLSGGNTSLRALRGGAWNNKGSDCRSSNRAGLGPDVHNYDVGFRVVRSAGI